MRRITYAIERESGLVYSRMDDKVAIPILRYDMIGQDGDFRGPIRYELEKCSVFSLVSEWNTLHWTKKIPIDIKNRHRIFWGMKPL